MSKNNLYQIVNYDDLLYFLRAGEEKVIGLSIVLMDTDEGLKRMYRKYIKRLSEKYPAVTFLYFPARKEDLGRIKFLPTDVNQYPKMCHIYDRHRVLFDTGRATTEKELNAGLSEVASYYERMSNIENSDDDNTESNNRTQSHSNTSKQQGQNSQIQQQKEQQLFQKMVPQRQNNQNSQNSQDMPLDPVLENKKLMEKLIFIREKGEEYNIEFMKECQKRRKMEDKGDKKQKKSKKR